MKHCTNCGTPLPDENNFCGHCGMAVKDMLFDGEQEQAVDEVIEEIEAETETPEELEKTEEPEEVVETVEEPEAPEEAKEPTETEKIEETEEIEAIEEEPEETEEIEAIEEEVGDSEEVETAEELEKTEESEEPFTLKDLEAEQKLNGSEVQEPTLMLGADFDFAKVEAAQQAKAEMLKSNDKSKPAVPKKAIIFGVIALLVVGGIIAISSVISEMNSGVKVDLAEFMSEPEFGGVEGNGIIITEAAVNDETVSALMNDISDTNERFKIKSFFNTVVFEGDKDADLSEGDEVTYTIRYNETMAEEAGLKIINNTATVTVGKLDVLDANMVGTWTMVAAERDDYKVNMWNIRREFNGEPTIEFKEDGTGILTLGEDTVTGNVIDNKNGTFQFTDKKDIDVNFYVDEYTGELRLDYSIPEDSRLYYNNNSDNKLTMIFQK